MNAWLSEEVTLRGLTTIAPSTTKKVVSKKVPVTGGGSKHLIALVKLTLSGTGTVTIGATTLTGSGHSRETKTATLTASGVAELRFNNNLTADQAHLPLLNMLEVFVTTGAGITVSSIDSVEVIQEQ